jgi:hypothetical protein
MLTSSGFGNDSFLTKPLRHQNLTDGIIDFVCSGMAQVFTFKVYRSAYFSR